MTAAPYVELHFDPTGFKPEAIPRAGAFLGTPAEALEAALAVTRAEVVRKAQLEIASIGVPTESQFLRIMDLAWQATFWRYRKVSAPIIADAYLSAYRAANAGDVPSSVIYALADQHTEKTGEYFYTSSREALSEGFNTLVNRRVPAKAAADRVTEGFGLTPRQMRAYTAASKFDTPVSSTEPRSLKARARAYVEKAFRGRVRKLAKQEEHNIDEQAKQFAWMWLQDKGRLNQRAQKLWITARDERVCPTCGPLHGVKIGINEQFKTTEGEFWTPGLHPNCRCVVRLIENRFSKNLAGTALAEFNHEHPRGEGGRFGTKTRTKTIDVDEEFERIVRAPVRTETEEETKRRFEDIVSVIPPSGHGVQVFYGRPTGVGVKPPPPAPVTTELPLAAVTTNARQTKVAQEHRVEARTRAHIKNQVKTKVRALPDTKTVTTRQGVKTGLERGNQIPLLVTEADTSPDGQYVYLHPDMTARDVESAIATAAQDVQDQVDNEVARVLKEGTNFSANEGKLYKLDEENLYKTAEYRARFDISEDLPYETGVEQSPFVWADRIDPRGKPVLDHLGKPDGELFPAKFLGEKFDMREFSYNKPQVVNVDKDQLGEGGTFKFKPEVVLGHEDFNIAVREVKPVKGQLKKRD